MAGEAMWYVAHTYSGYENKVKANIEKSVENRGIGDLIQAVEVPMEDVIEEKNGEQKVVKRKVFPGYVVIKMVMNEDTWYVVRNTRGVTGFVGPGSKPVPLSDDEVKKMGVEQVRMADVDLEIGDNVNVKSGPLEGFSGKIESIDKENRKATVRVSMFGRETPIEVEFGQIEKTL